MRRRLLPLLAVALVAVPTAWAATIQGTTRADRIAAQNGVRDRVSCGRGRDIVTADLFDLVDADCEVLSRQLSRDTTTATDAQHETQVEPDSFAYGRTIVAAFQSGRYDNGGAAAIGWATSSDAASTWHSGFLPQTTDRVSDPSVAYDAVHGVWLIALLGLQDRTVSMLLSRSPDGVHWEAPATIAAGTFPAGGFDKEWIACDNWSSSPFRGRCYLSYLNTGTGGLETRWSGDGGATWSPPVATSAGVAPKSDVNGATPVVRPDGGVVVGFMVIAPFGELDGDWIGVSQSVDGGGTFSEAAHVSDLQSEPVVGMRAPPLPSLDVDAAGRVYVAWSDCRFHAECSANDIVLATSRDGVTWTPPARVPTRNPAEEVDHFVPGLAVDPVSAGASARVAVAYYSLRQPNGCSIELCPNMSMNVIESKNGGATWSRPQRLNVETMRVGWLANGGIGGMVGDYISTSYVGGRAVPVFALTSPPSGEVLREAIFAGVRLG